MIRKLRRKFILLSTTSLVLLLGIIVISSNYLTYRELVADAEMILDMILENQGYVQEKALADSAALEEKNLIQEFFTVKRMHSLEIMYESRFFTTVLSDTGEVRSVSTEHIAMVDDAQAEAYARQVFGKRADRGFIDDFRYRRIYDIDDSSNDFSVIFLDCGRKLFTFRNTLGINCLISFMGLFVIFLIIAVLSGKIVRPVSDSYEKQKQFIAVAGHEIKTPITIIDADAELLSMEIGEENEWLLDIRRQTKRMTALTNDLLTLSRMDADQQQYTMIDFPISDVVGEMAGAFQTLARSRGRKIRAEIAPMLSYCGDENSIRQVVGILLDNAIKYSSSEEILLKLGKKNHNIFLCVRNHAKPVSPAQLRHFFDRFYRTEQSRSADSGGYGLGLPIAKSLVEAHQGRISVSARGANLMVLLPVYKCSL